MYKSTMINLQILEKWLCCSRSPRKSRDFLTKWSHDWQICQQIWNCHFFHSSVVDKVFKSWIKKVVPRYKSTQLQLKSLAFKILLGSYKERYIICKNVQVSKVKVSIIAYKLPPSYYYTLQYCIIIIITDVFMVKQHFNVIAGWSGATFNYLI